MRMEMILLKKKRLWNP